MPHEDLFSLACARRFGDGTRRKNVGAGATRRHNTAKGPPFPVLFSTVREKALSLSPFPLLFLIRRNPKRRDLSVTEGDDDDYDYDYDEEEDGIDEDSRRRGGPAAAQVLDLFDCFRQSRLSLPLKASSMKDYSSAMDNFDRGRGQPRRPFFVAWRFCGMSILLRFVQLPSFSSFFLFFFLSFLLSPSYPLPAVLAWDDLRCLLFEIYIYVGFRVLVKRTIVHVGK